MKQEVNDFFFFFFITEKERHSVKGRDRKGERDRDFTRHRLIERMSFSRCL